MNYYLVVAMLELVCVIAILFLMFTPGGREILDLAGAFLVGRAIGRFSFWAAPRVQRWYDSL